MICDLVVYYLWVCSGISSLLFLCGLMLQVLVAFRGFVFGWFGFSFWVVVD